MEVAIGACPTKRSVCGKKRHFVYDSDSAPSRIEVDFAIPDTDYTYKAKAGARQPFDIDQDSCHWLIQTKCDLPILKFTHQMNGISQQKAEDIINYDPKFIQGDDYEPLEIDLDASSPDELIRLSYIEYQPTVVQ